MKVPVRLVTIRASLRSFWAAAVRPMARRRSRWARHASIGEAGQDFDCLPRGHPGTRGDPSPTFEEGLGTLMATGFIRVSEVDFDHSESTVSVPTVHAGPTGLVLAQRFLANGVRFRIIDRARGGGHWSGIAGDWQGRVGSDFVGHRLSPMAVRVVRCTLFEVRRVRKVTAASKAS